MNKLQIYILVLPVITAMGIFGADDQSNLLLKNRRFRQLFNEYAMQERKRQFRYMTLFALGVHMHFAAQNRANIEKTEVIVNSTDTL